MASEKNAGSGLAALIQHLAFREIQPEDVLPPPAELVNGQLQGNLSEILIGDLVAEKVNLILPPELEESANELLQLADMPRMCSFAIGLLLFEAVKRMPENQAYLNIGVWHGFTFLAGLLAKPDGLCIGVDNFSEWGGPRDEFMARFGRFKGPRDQFHDLDYVNYLRQIHRGPIGVYLFDGPHRELDQSRGLELAHPHLASGALIFVDDSNLLQVKAPTLAFINNHPEYKLIADLRTASNTHPTWWNGLMILEKA